MKKFLSLFTLLTFMSVATFAQNACVGIWKTIDDETGEVKSQVQIYEQNGKYYGKVLKLLRKNVDPNKKCDACSGDKKGKPIVGMVIMENLYYKDGFWQGGTILDPEKGKVYSCKFWLKDGDPNKLELRGFLGFSALGRTQTWYRVQ